MRCVLLGVALLAGCGSPTHPSSSLAGIYAGTISSSNWSTRTVTMTLQANGSGSWTAQADWRGTVDVIATGATISGALTITLPTSLDQKETCVGSATVTGSAEGTALQLRGQAFTGPCPAMPLQFALTLRR